MDKENTHCILVVVEADFFPVVLGVGSVVDNALCIMHIAVLTNTSRRGQVGGIAHVEHEESAFAAGATRGPDGIYHVLLLMRDDVVRGSETTIPSSQIFAGVERLWRTPDGQELWRLVRNKKEMGAVGIYYLSHVEDLKSVIGRFRPNIRVPVDNLHITPW